MKKRIAIFTVLIVLAGSLFAENWFFNEMYFEADGSISYLFNKEDNVEKGNQLIGLSGHFMTFWNDFAGLSLGAGLNVCICDFDQNETHFYSAKNDFFLFELNTGICFRLINTKVFDWITGPEFSILLRENEKDDNYMTLPGIGIQNLMLFKLSEEIGFTVRIDFVYCPVYANNLIVGRFRDKGFCNKFYLNPSIGGFIRI